MARRSFRLFNPRNHCWPAVRKSMTMIVLLTMLYSLIETAVIYEIVCVFQDAAKNIFFAVSILFGIVNAVLMNKYANILVLPRYGKSPRFPVYLGIGTYTFFFISAFFSLEYDVRMPMFPTFVHPMEAPSLKKDFIALATCIVIYILFLAFVFITQKTRPSVWDDSY